MMKFPQDINADRLFNLWESIGITGLFRLEVSWDTISISHTYNLKNTNLKVKATVFQTNQPDKYKITFYEDGASIPPGDFWEKVPLEFKKVLCYHLDILS